MKIKVEPTQSKLDNSEKSKGETTILMDQTGTNENNQDQSSLIKIELLEKRAKNHRTCWTFGQNHESYFRNLHAFVISFLYDSIIQPNIDTLFWFNNKINDTKQ